jgi:hypothetical protein
VHSFLSAPRQLALIPSDVTWTSAMSYVQECATGLRHKEAAATLYVGPIERSRR